MWTARENRYATALKNRGQQKNAVHTFPTLFHRLTTIAPKRKEWGRVPAAQNSTSFFRKEKPKTIPLQKSI